MKVMSEDYNARKAKLTQEVNKFVEDVSKFDVDKSSPSDLDNLYKELDRVREELEDMVSEVEVEHFLQCGPGKKDKKETYEKK